MRSSVRKRPSLARWTLSFLAAGIAVAAAVACGTSHDGANALPEPGAPADGGLSDGPQIQPAHDAGEPCSNEGESRACSQTIGMNNGVLSCFHGKQVCENGAWTACKDGTRSRHLVPREKQEEIRRAIEAASGSVQRVDVAGFASRAPLADPQVQNPIEVLSLSDASACVGNPCDPGCQMYNEDPDGGITSDAGSSGNWQVGNLNDLTNAAPAGLVKMGLIQPCGSALDCQFDEYCQDPTTPSACAHSKCSTGGPLNGQCDPNCVAKICAAEPSCCASGGKWDTTCIAKVASVCGAFCPQDGSCDHDKCLGGAPLASGCDSCVSAICKVDPYCCSTGWDNFCINQVGSVCGVNCNPPQGQCIPWGPSQTDPSCPGVDLTVGVPCGNTVPICNRGQTDAAPGFQIVTYPANSQQYPTCNPTPSGNQAQYCTVNVPIPAGQCVDFSCNALTNTREVMVNPPGAGHVAECHCENNWSVYKKDNQGTLACGAPACVSQTSTAHVPTVNLFFMQDKSGSMCEPQASYGCTKPGSKTRWALTTSALTTFFQDPASAGINAALRFFPDNFTLNKQNYYCDGYYWWECYDSACSSPDYCGFGGCAQPLVPLGTLLVPTVAGITSNTNCGNSSDPQECNLVKAILSRYPNGGTPIYTALGGALTYMGNQAWANPYARWAVVFVTDGEPTACDTNNSDIVYLASYAYSNWGIVTYTIGLDNAAGAPLLQDVANAGHGQFFDVSVSTSGSSQQVSNALNAIRQNSISCDLVIDQAVKLDPTNVTVTYTSGAGVSTNLPQVSSATACGNGNGFYYDNPTSPTKVTLCPTSCSTARSDTSSSIQLTVGCPKVYQPTTLNYVYSSTCPLGQHVQWEYLAYDTTDPGDSNVVFQARTSNDSTTFNTPPAAGTLHNLATANASLPICPLSGPSPCPVNLYTGLNGLPDATNTYLELWVTLNPTSNGSMAPTLNDWNVTYTCVATE